MALVAQAEGGYLFLPGASNSPYSSGVVAMPGYEIVHATLRSPLPYRDGFARIERHLAAEGRPRAALCAVELRCAAPYAPSAWMGPGTFNARYLDLLEEWGLFVDGLNPIARTNIAPAVDPPAEQVLDAFSYTVPCADPAAPLTFVAAGSAEAPGVRPGETSLEALRAKTVDVVATIQRRITGLGATWSDVTDVGLYTVHDVHPLLEREILGALGPAARRGIHWYVGRPPIADREIEIDVRGIRREMRLS